MAIVCKNYAQYVNYFYRVVCFGLIRWLIGCFVSAELLSKLQMNFCGLLEVGQI